jgi:WD40 repeat protein
MGEGIVATTDSATRKGPEVASVYDGFISYSHAADDQLAPRLQAGLQRFAKPWWKRRALRIFRDEASLSANPHLWSSITEAMDQSDWFVLLLSEEAAKSEWVDREVAYWLELKDPERIIPVVTDGEFSWADGDIGPDSTAAPPSLLGAFADEPRWVDLRFARTEQQLDLRHTEFRSAVADIASAVRSVAKDELESEEIRQHRRTVRTAWAAGVTVLLLGVAATVGAVVAVDQSNEAQTQRDEAERLALEETNQRAEAERQATIAEENEQRAREAEADARAQAEIAEREKESAREQSQIAQMNEQRALTAEADALKKADLARARELAVSAINVLEEDPELSVLLALLAADRADPPSVSVSVLHEALQSHRTMRAITWPEGWDIDTMAGSMSPDGRYLAASGAQHQMAVWDLTTALDDPIWQFKVPWPDHARIIPYFTEDGSQVVATVAWFSLSDPVEDWPEPPPEVGVYLFDTQSGEVIRHFRGPDCPVISLFQTGRFLDETRLVGAGSPAAEDCSLSSGANLWLLDLITGDATLTDMGSVESKHWRTPATLTEDGRYLSFIQSNTAKVVDLHTGEEVFETLGPLQSRLSRDGSVLMAVDAGWIKLWDIESGTEIWRADSPGSLFEARFSEDERLIYAGALDGTVRIWDVATGVLHQELKGHRTQTWFESMTIDGSTLATFGERTTRIWDLTASGESEIAGFNVPGLPILQGGNIVGDRGVILLHLKDRIGTQDPWTVPGVAFVFDTLSGEEYIFDGYGGQMVRLSPDGKLLVGQSFIAPGIVGPVHIRDVESGEVLVELEGLCTFDTVERIHGADCAENPEALGDLNWWIGFSPDGSMVAVSGESSPIVGVWDVESGERQIWLDVPAAAQYPVAFWFHPTSELLVTATSEHTVYDTATWSVLATFPVDYYVIDSVFAPDGLRLFAADLDAGLVTIDANLWQYVPEALTGHAGQIRDIAISSDGTLIASGGFDGFVNIWNAETGDKIQTLPFGDHNITLIEFINDKHLLVIAQGRPAMVMTIDIAELIAIARSKMTRGFTEDECVTYQFDPCPTLEDIRSNRP